MISPLRKRRTRESLRRISRSGVRLGNLSASISLNGAMASRLSSVASDMFGSNAASQRCGRSRMVGAAGISGVENEVGFRAADAGEASARFRLRVGLLEIMHAAEFDGDGARPATAGAAAGINFDSMR